MARPYARANVTSPPRSTDTTPEKLCSPAAASTASGREFCGFIDAVYGRRAKPSTSTISSASLGVWLLEPDCERSADFQVAQQEGALIESPAP
jgi:hypothetical protein